MMYFVSFLFSKNGAVIMVSSDNSTHLHHQPTPIPASEDPNITGNVMLLPSFGLGMSAPANSAEVLTDRKDGRKTYRT